MDRQAILRLPDVQKRVGLSRSSIYTAINRGQFPRSISLGTRSVGWLESDIAGWIDLKVENCRRANI